MNLQILLIMMGSALLAWGVVDVPIILFFHINGVISWFLGIATGYIGSIGGAEFYFKVIKWRD